MSMRHAAPDDRWIRALPKVELHCHLDACVRVATVAGIARETGVAVPDPPEAALVAPQRCANLFDYIARIDLALAVLQRPSDLTRAAAELVEDMADDGVVHGEVRFAPQLHTRSGMTAQDAVAAVDRGLAEAAGRHGISTALIVCALRHQTAEESLAVARVAADSRPAVAALDLAGDEGGFPDASPHAPAFRLARDAGLRLTAHAGENAGPSSVRQALALLGAERIGHGVRIEDDDDLVESLRRARVSLDMCPTSNVQTCAVASLIAHPIDRLHRRGLRVTVSTDGRTVSGTTLSAELRALTETLGWSDAELIAVQRNAAEAAFVSAERRAELLRAIGAFPPAR